LFSIGSVSPVSDPLSLLPPPQPVMRMMASIIAVPTKNIKKPKDLNTGIESILLLLQSRIGSQERSKGMLAPD
jgi:hypothetical protein